MQRLCRFSAIAEFHLYRSIFRSVIHLFISTFYTIGFFHCFSVMCSENSINPDFTGSWSFNYLWESGWFYWVPETSI